MFCKNCGAPLTPEKRFCSRCGTAVEAETPVTLEAKVDLTPNPTPDTPNPQPTADVQQTATNPAQAAPNAQPTAGVQQDAASSRYCAGLMHEANP